MNYLKKINIWFLLLVALFQFPLKLAGPFRYLTYLYIYLIPLIYITKNCWFFMDNKQKSYQLSKIIYIALLLMSILWPIINCTLDFSYITKYWSQIVLWIIKYSFLMIFFVKNVLIKNPFEEFSEYFIRGAGIYSFVSLLSALVKPMRDMMLKIIYLTEGDKRNLMRAEYSTRFGWTGWSSFNETYVCTIAIILGCIIIYHSNSWEKRKHYILLLIGPYIGNAMFGRTGLLVSTICLLITFLILILRGDFKVLLLSMGGCILAITLFFVLKERIEVLNSWYKWVFSAFNNYRMTGRFYDSMGTIEHLITDMYWMPSIDTLLFGDGRYFNSNGSYYMHTDSGIMRPILYYGVVNYILSLIAVLLIVKQFLKEIMFWNNRKCYFIISLFLPVLIIFEFKGETLWMFLGVFVPFINLLNYTRKMICCNEKNSNSHKEKLYD